MWIPQSGPPESGGERSKCTPRRVARQPPEPNATFFSGAKEVQDRQISSFLPLPHLIRSLYPRHVNDFVHLSVACVAFNSHQ